MDRVHFFDGQRIEAEDLNNGIDRLASNLKDRTVDFFSHGVVGSRTSAFVQKDINNCIKMMPFVAYTLNGERINVYQTIGALALDISDTTTDILKKYRLRQQGDLDSDDFGWIQNETYQIYVNYIEKGGKPQANNATGIFYPTRVYSGFEFYAIPSSTTVDINTTNMVRLCAVTFDGNMVNIKTAGYLQYTTVDANKIYTSENAASPTNYNPRLPVSVEEHIMALGSGTPSATNPHGYTPEDLGFDVISVQTHEKRMHSTGISGTQSARTSVNSAFYIKVNSITGFYDNLLLSNLATGEYLHSNGYWLESLSATTNPQVFLQFSKTASNGTTTPLPAGVYIIGVDPSSGALSIGASIDDPENYSVLVTSDSAGLSVLQEVTIIPLDTYVYSGAFSLARFTWDPALNPKPSTTIESDAFDTSNFTSKEDLRVFGGTDSLDLKTSKDSHNSDILTLPYTVTVDKLRLASGAEITGQAMLPYGFVYGYTLSYVANNVVTINPGWCRDQSNTVDIVLTSPITKQIDIPWAPGGYGGAVGGLSNQDASMSEPYITPGDVTNGLHVFILKNINGEIDAAIDTNIYGTNLRNGSGTSTYQYIRRIGSLYLSHLYGSASDSRLTHPYTSVSEGNGLWVYYNTPIELTASMYTPASTQWLKCGVPTGSSTSMNLFRGKFNVRSLAAEKRFYSNYITAPNYIAGTTTFDIQMSDQALRMMEDFGNFSTQHIYCLGYYDARNN